MCNSLWLSCLDFPWFSSRGCCSCPGFHLRLGASDCSPGLAFCFMGLCTFAWICPYHRCKNGTHSTCFTAQRGTRRKFRRCWKMIPRFSGSAKCYPCQGLGTFRQGKRLLENWPGLRERCWIFSSETATAFLSSSDRMIYGMFFCSDTFKRQNWPRNRTSESRPGDPRPNYVVCIFVT